jgi:hypothetical protein
MATRGLRQAGLLGGLTFGLVLASACGRVLPDDAAPDDDPDAEARADNAAGDAFSSPADGARESDSGAFDAPPGIDVDVAGDCNRAMSTPIAFVTSSVFPGNYNGGLGASKFDALCSTLATAAGLQGSFKAFMLDGTTAPSDRVGVSSSGWQRPDGIPVVSPGVPGTTLLAPINVSEKCTVVADNVGAWTGVRPGSNTDPADCTNWSSASFTGYYGEPGAIDGTWLASTAGSCGVARHVYCFQLVDP